MANRKTREPDLVELYRLLEKARGDDRSFRTYAKDAGVQHNVFTRIKQEDFVPGILTLHRLTSEAAAPRNGVTFNDLMAAAGTPEFDYNGLARSISMLGSVAKAVQPQVDFQKDVMYIISNTLSEMNIGYEVDDDNDRIQIIGLELAGKLKIHNETVSALWLRSWYANSEQDYGGYGCAQEKAIDLLREPLILNSDPLRKYTIAVNSREVYNGLCVYVGKTSYRGWLSVVLIDTKEKQILAETTIATFTGKDEQDPLKLAENN